MDGGGHRRTQSMSAHWHMRTHPLANTEYENMDAKRIASDKRCVFNFVNNKRW
jgi:hypothetical protein